MEKGEAPAGSIAIPPSPLSPSPSPPPTWGKMFTPDGWGERGGGGGAGEPEGEI